MAEIARQLPASNLELRRAVHEGTIFLLAANSATQAFVDEAESLLVEAVGAEPRSAHRRFDAERLFQAVGALRRRLFFESRFHEHVRCVIAALGFDRKRVAFDPARFRAVFHGSHRNLMKISQTKNE